MGRSGYNHDDSEDGDCSSAADSRATEPDRDSSRADRLVVLRSLYREIRGMIIALGPRQPEIKLDGSFRSVGDSLNGNPRLAALMATDPVFLIVRRYRYLQARLLLHIQEDLNSYETELDRLDREQLSDKQPDRKESERDDLSEEQRKVLEKVSASLAQYGQVASLVQQFDKYDEPSTSRLRSLQNFFEVNKPFGNDKSYYRHKNDLMVLRDMKSDTFIDRTFVHPLLERPGKFLKRLFRDPTHVDSDEHITINDRRKVVIFNTTFAISILLLILVGPIYPLYYLSQIQSRGVMLLGTAFTQIAFVAIFTVFVGLFTTAKRHELFAIVTTYIGLLVVFMSQTLNLSPSSS